MVGKNFIYFTTPYRPNQTSLQPHRKKKRKKAGGGGRKKKERVIPFPSCYPSPLPPSLPPLSFFLFFSRPPAPFCSVFRLSSLREWNTIKDLIKTPEQAKSPQWQRARRRPGPGQALQAGSASYSAPRAGLWGLSGGVEGAEGRGGVTVVAGRA